jgi:hypothetical protein
MKITQKRIEAYRSYLNGQIQCGLGLIQLQESNNEWAAAAETENHVDAYRQELEAFNAAYPPPVDEPLNWAEILGWGVVVLFISVILFIIFTV